jgi:uncharacterized surface protein with fasciclin (FAS1) repeats
MKNMKTHIKIASTLLAISLIPAVAHAHCGACGADAHKKEHKHAHKSDIVETAVNAGSFNTLAAALTAAGLVDTLKGEGPFTVFAPTDEAFAKLPAGTVESLLKPENKAQLVDILTYHVVAGKVKAEKVVTMDSATTVQGGNVSIKVKDGTVYVDDAKVIKTDIKASNGIIHVIDSVIIPNS